MTMTHGISVSKCSNELTVVPALFLLRLAQQNYDAPNPRPYGATGFDAHKITRERAIISAQMPQGFGNK